MFGFPRLFLREPFFRFISTPSIHYVNKSFQQKHNYYYRYYSTQSNSILSWLSDVEDDDKFILEDKSQQFQSVTTATDPLEVKLRKNFSRKNYTNIENIISKLQANKYKISAKCYYYLQFTYIEQKKLNAAIGCLSKMKENQIEPIEENYSIILHGLIKENKIKNAEILFWQIMEENENTKIEGEIISNTIINALIKYNIQHAIEFTESILVNEKIKLKIKAKIIGKIMNYFINVNEYSTAVEWYQKFEEINTEKIAIAGNKLIKSIIQFNNFSKSSIEEGTKIIQQMKQNGIQFDVETLNILLKLKFIEKNSKNLLQFLQEFLENEKNIFPNEQTFQLLLLSFSNDLQFNFNEFQQMIEAIHSQSSSSLSFTHQKLFHGFLYTPNIFNNFFQQVTNRGRSGESPICSRDLENIYNLLKKLNISFSSEIYASLIHFYFINENDFGKIQNLIADLKISNIPVFGDLAKILLDFYKKTGNYEAALAIFMAERSNQKRIDYLPALFHLLIHFKYSNSPPSDTVREIIRISSFAYAVPLSTESFVQIFKFILKNKFTLWPDFLDFLENHQSPSEMDVFYNHFIAHCLKMNDFIAIGNVLDRILSNPAIVSKIELKDETMRTVIHQSFLKGDYLFVCKFYEQLDSLDAFRVLPFQIPLDIGEELIRSFLFLKKPALVSSLIKKWQKERILVPDHLQRLIRRAGFLVD